MQRIFKNITPLLLLLAVHFLQAQPTTRIQLPQLQEAPNTDTVWVIVSSGDTAIWAIADTLTTAGGGGGVTPYVSTENTGASEFDTLDFTVRQDILSTPLYLTAETVGTNERIRIGYDLGLVDASESNNSGDFGLIYTGTIARRPTLDTLFGFDVFQLNGTALEISQRLDGDATYSVDLSDLKQLTTFGRIYEDPPNNTYSISTTYTTIDSIAGTTSSDFTVTPATGVLNYSGSDSGNWLLFWTATVSCDTAGKTITIAPYRDSIELPRAANSQYMAVANKKYTLSGFEFQTLFTSVDFTMRALIDSGTANVTFEKLHMYLIPQ